MARFLTVKRASFVMMLAIERQRERLWSIVSHARSQAREEDIMSKIVPFARCTAAVFASFASLTVTRCRIGDLSCIGRTRRGWPRRARDSREGRRGRVQ